MSPQLEAYQGLMTVPGFRATGYATGVKTGRPDLAIIHSTHPNTTAAAVFTQNAFAAAPVHVGRQHVADGRIQAIVINAGNANACTGRQGLRDCLTMADEAAQALGLKREQILVCSTGIIGRPMPMDKIVPGIHAAVATLDDAVGGEAALAILTTDSGPKEAQATFTIDGVEHHIAGMAKGAGMIHPNMATMLGFLVTDANVPPKALRAALTYSVDRSFNQITVDGCESTNDTCALLANGAAEGPKLTPSHPEWHVFQDALTGLCQDLAKQIPADGEGATRLLTVEVEGARDNVQARKIARAIARSDLVKAAVHGADANWGRIVAAIGQEARDVKVVDTSITVASNNGRMDVLRDGEPLEKGRKSAVMDAPEVTFYVSVGDGPGTGTAWGCDLTTDYVSFNAEYTT